MPEGAKDYLKMNLDLTPNELMRTSRFDFDRAEAFQSARQAGINEARDEDRKRKAEEQEAATRAKREQASLTKLRGR